MTKKKISILIAVIAVIALVVTIGIVMFVSWWAKRPDFDFTFSTSMAECKVFGEGAASYTPESLLEYAQAQGLEWYDYDRYYAGEGYLIHDAFESEGYVCVMGLDKSFMAMADSVYFYEGKGWEHFLLEEYADSGIAVIESDLLGMSYEEFFNGLADGLYDKVQERAQSNEKDGKVTFQNGYVYKNTHPKKGDLGLVPLTDEWRIFYEENGRQYRVEVGSISNEKIDLIHIYFL